MTKPDTLNITLSPLDSTRFGVPIARATLTHCDHVAASAAYCRDHQIALLFVRCSVHDIAIAQQLEAAGAHLMDTLLYLRHSLHHIPAVTDSPPVYIAQATPDDAPAVGAAARAAFRGYRNHYTADSRLDATLSDMVYVSWAERACRDPQVADSVFIAMSADTLAGFGVLQRTAPTVGDGRLYGVVPAFQGQGIYRQLLVHSLWWCHAQGYDRMLYSTQLTNTAAQRRCLQVGFVPDHAFYTFHWWFHEDTL